MVTTRDIKYSYADVPTLRSFAASNAFIRGVVGPVGGGKSSACVIEVPARGLAQRHGPDGIRRTRWAVIRGTYPMLRDTTMKTFFQWLPPEHFGRFHSTEHRYTIKAFEHAEIEVLFLALDKPDDIKKLLSLELTGAWVNEGRETPWSIIEALQGRLGRYPAQKDGGPSWHGMWLDTNPPDADSKWYKFFEEHKHPASFAQIFHQPGGLTDQAENLGNLPGGRRYYETLSIGKSKEWIDVYINAQYGFVADGKPVYPEYNDRIHCQKIDPIEAPILRSYDFGLTPACVFSQVLPDGRWLVFDELTSDNMGIDRFSDEVLEHCSRRFPRGATFNDYGDPAGDQRAQTDERTCFDIMRAKGIMIEGAEQNPVIRIESVRKPLRTLINGEPQFIMHPRCKMLRKGFLGGYHYRRMQTTSERYTDKPEKNELSHVHDACQYGATTLFAGGLTRRQDDDGDDWARHDYGNNDQGRSETTGY